MIRSQSLKKLQRTFDRRITRLEALAVASETAGNEMDRTVSYVTIEALNAWSSFSREFYLSCAQLKPKSIQGSKITANVSIATERDAILFAISKTKPPNVYTRASAGSSISPRDEPTWHELATLVSLSGHLNLSNHIQIVTALAYPTTFFRHAPTVRNFFAHRNQGTKLKIKNLCADPSYAISFTKPSSFLMHNYNGRPITIIRDWLEDIRLISFDICQ